MLLRTLTLLAILCPAIFAQATQPNRVATAAFVNQSTAIPVTTLYTPAQDGLFRVSGYVEVTPSSDPGCVAANLSWQDDIGKTGGGLVPNCVELNRGKASASTVVRAKAGTPITLSTNGNFPCTSACGYNIFVTVESLWFTSTQ